MEQRAAMLSHLAAQPVCRRAEAKATAAALNLSERHVYHLVRRLRTAKTSSTAPESGHPRRKGGTRLPEAVERHLDRILDEETLARTDEGRSRLFRAVYARCQREISPAPSGRTIFRRPRQREQARVAADEPAQAPPLLRGRPPAVPTESLLLPLYKTIGDPNGWRGFLDSLSHAYGGSLSCITSYDFANRTGILDASSGADREFETSYVHRYARLNPWMAVLERLPVGLATLSDNILPYADLQRTEFYNDWLRPQQVGGGVGGFVERNGRRVVAATILMPRPVLDQDPGGLSRLEILMPHILWVSQLHRQFAALEARATAAEGAIDRLATAMLLLNASGQIVYLNALAERIVAAGDGLRVRHGKLEAASVAEDETMRQLIDAARRAVPGLDSRPGGVMSITRRSGRQSFELLAAPISGTMVRLGFTGSLVAVFIREPEARYNSPALCLSQLYGLTAAESRLMQALLAGDTLDEAGARFAVTRETVRTQLKAIFQKTGTASQSALLRLGLRSLAARYG
jgi:DNA-binding CsgD family transcriptional regulator/PAS domain-containing protein